MAAATELLWGLAEPADTPTMRSASNVDESAPEQDDNSVDERLEEEMAPEQGSEPITQSILTSDSASHKYQLVSTWPN